MMDAISLIQKHEGLRLSCYDDATGEHVVPGYTLKGHPTIGYGRTLDIDGISPSEAVYLLNSELGPRVMDLLAIFTLPRWTDLGAPRQAALLDMHYALGATGFRKFHHMITALMNQKWDDANAAILDSQWATAQAPERAREDATIISTGEFSASNC